MVTWHHLTKKSQKNSPPGVSLQGTTFQSGFGQPESLQERRRVRFGNRTLPLILPAQCVCRLQVLSHEFESTGRRFDPRRGSAEPRSLGFPQENWSANSSQRIPRKGVFQFGSPIANWWCSARLVGGRRHTRPSRARGVVNVKRSTTTEPEAERRRRRTESQPQSDQRPKTKQSIDLLFKHRWRVYGKTALGPRSLRPLPQLSPSLRASEGGSLWRFHLLGAAASQHDAMIGPTHGARAQSAARSTASPRRTEAAVWKARCGSTRL